MLGAVKARFEENIFFFVEGKKTKKYKKIMFFSTPGAASNQYIFVKMVECEKLENGNFGVTRNKNI